MSFVLEQFYRFFQGVLLFQIVFLGILYTITRRKDIFFFCAYLFFQAVYFFWNAPYTFFNITEETVFSSPLYAYANTPLVIIGHVFYILFLKSFFSGLYQNKKTTRLINFLLFISPILILISVLSIYIQQSNQYIFYTVNFLSTALGIYILSDIYTKKIKNTGWVAAGILLNIIGNALTVLMIILARYNIHHTLTDYYPLFFMRCGILADIFFYLIAILKKWQFQEKQLAIEKIEKVLAVEKVRTQLSKELHDDIGGTLSGINMYSHLAKQQTTEGNNAASDKTLDLIRQASDEMIYKLKDIVWAMQPGNESLEQLTDKIKEYAIFISGAKKIELQTHFTPDQNGIKLSAETMHHIYSIAKEALNNAVKYSGATLISINTSFTSDHFILNIKDTGAGYDRQQIVEGNGLINMQKRAAEIGAGLQLSSKLGHGTELQLNIKITH
ncbi:hypothetical protein CAP36_08380 [Chitinophagaceae bacterium IBVUCB2]|nr:hypothetical protein CAP36_08380 [Chitinophagaceae bacterium IBVUCB2]